MIRDRGPGVDALALTKLTGRFWRQDSGLGLAIVAAITKRFAGHLRFEHNQPQGLVARLWFPLDPRSRRWLGERRATTHGDLDAPAHDNKRPQANWHHEA